MTSANVFISGFVQGVGFRKHVLGIARDLSLAGWVKNLPDKRVEALFVGSKEDIDKAIEQCRKGSFISEVENVEVEWNDSSESLDSFKIIR